MKVGQRCKVPKYGEATIQALGPKIDYGSGPTPRFIVVVPDILKRPLQYPPHQVKIIQGNSTP